VESLFNSWEKHEIFWSTKCPDWLRNLPQSPTKRVPGGSIPEVRWAELVEDYQSSPSSAQIKNEWSYTCRSPYAFKACTRTILPLYQHFYGTERPISIRSVKSIDTSLIPDTSFGSIILALLSTSCGVAVSVCVSVQKRQVEYQHV